MEARAPTVSRQRETVRELPTMPLWTAHISSLPPFSGTHTPTHTHSNKAECLTQQTVGQNVITHVCLLAQHLVYFHFALPPLFLLSFSHKHSVYQFSSNTCNLTQLLENLFSVLLYGGWGGVNKYRSVQRSTMTKAPCQNKKKRSHLQKTPSTDNPTEAGVYIYNV